MKVLIKSLLETALPDAMVIVESDDDVHFNVTVVSDKFIGLTKLKQQQLVYAALGERIKNGEIHALSMRTFTHDAWQK